MDEIEESLRSALMDSMHDIKDRYSYPDLGRAFQHWSAVNLLGLEDGDVEDFLADAKGKDGGIDYFYINATNKTVEIVQAKFSESLDASVGRESIGDLYEIPKRLLADTETSRSTRFQEQQREYKIANANGYSTNLFFVIAGNLSPDAKEFMRLKNQDLAGNIAFECIEIKDLLALIGNPNSPPCALRLFRNEYFISNQGEGETKKMVATVTASELKNICEIIGAPTLFSLNPRSYLGHRGIAKRITRTIQEEPDNLWHYNNGISAVCKRFEHDREEGVVRIENLKVVNGCQTITTINKSTMVSGASVVFRLSETDDDKFRENISKFTNDQNRILPPDLAANHPYLLKLEKKFSKYRPFFWERKKGTVLYMSKDEIGRIRGKRDLYIIKNLDSARLKMAYMGSPNKSIQMSQQNLFGDTQGSSSEFQNIYKNADPRDFILPHVLHYWLNIIKKRLGKDGMPGEKAEDKNVRFLLKYSIGKYYVVGMIGRIFSAIEDPDVKDQIRDGIIKIVVEYDDDVANMVIDEIKKLAIWFAHITTKILDTQEDYDYSMEKPVVPLYKREVYYLRDRLRKINRLDSFYFERKSGVLDKGYDSFEKGLKNIFGI